MPFYDINFEALIESIDHNKTAAHKKNETWKVKIVQHNLHIFSAFYGFKFGENHNFIQIDNQSLYPLDLIFPSLKNSIQNKSQKYDKKKNYQISNLSFWKLISNQFILSWYL